MQPEPIEISSQLNLSTIPADFDTSQHGSYVPPLNSALQAHGQPGHFSSHTSSPEPGTPGNLEAHARRLSVSGRSTPAKASAQRISDYENALCPTPPKPEYEGPGFKVMKRKGHRLDGPQLDRFPNEVLTHILSHLPATSLSSVSLVSHRFYSLVTTPHAWRVAFSRFFPGQHALDEASSNADHRGGSDGDAQDHVRAEQRLFTRLTGLASWRSEYILRTRLLRSLGRGKPSQIGQSQNTSHRSNAAANNAVITYNSQLFATVNRIDASWNDGRKAPKFIHGTDETGSACTSDPSLGKVDAWGLSDPQSLPQFADLFPGDSMYGLGTGQVIGVPNSMDVSQQYGMVYGEGFPGGHAYFRAPEELRGKFLAPSEPYSEYELGIPRVPQLAEAICSVWIAKSPSIPTMTDGLVGVMTGSTSGAVTTYSLGADNLRDNRLAKGEITARWILSPGVPIIAIAVDDSYNVKRKKSDRIWAVVLNALGEVFYLTDIPVRTVVQRGSQLDERNLAKAAWQTGRSIYWNFTEPSRRLARDDTYHEFEYDGSYSPRSSCKSMNLNVEQVVAETKEIEKFVAFRPVHFQKVCEGWDMRRKLEVDFGGDDGNGAGEGIFVLSCGTADGEVSEIKRYTRLKTEQSSLEDYPIPRTPPILPAAAPMSSLFGGGLIKAIPQVKQSSRHPITPEQRAVSGNLVEEWRTSKLVLPNNSIEITACAIDMSTFALLTASEDPILTIGGARSASSPLSTPLSAVEGPVRSVSDVPGLRSRFLAVGTKVGSIVVWDMRGPQAANATLVNELHPLRTIVTESPQISCLALSALYLVHGGNDGLVQTWDTLASSLQPIRTLHSRFSSRARRRLIQAEASIQGVGINLYAAGAICIDPDPTVLRGMVSLGTHLRYWSYSSNGADQVSSKKRRLRRSNERGTNGATDRFTNTGRGALMDYIATEQEELKRDKERRTREEARLRGRFGVDFADMSEEEALRYAEMISQETFERDEQRRSSDAGSATNSSTAQSAWSSETVTPEGSVVDIPLSSSSVTSPKVKDDEELNQDIEEAIRLSLLDGIDEGGRSPPASASGSWDVPFKVKQKKTRRSASSSPSTSQVSRSRKEVIAVDDLEYALQLSMAEEASRRDAEPAIEDEGFPVLDEFNGKGKGRAF